jgi:hypothetical protein
MTLMAGNYARLMSLAALLSFMSLNASANIIISEVAPWGSGNTPYAADWFELTNTGNTTIDLSGWSWDDNSQIAGTSPLSGVSSILPGQSVVFIDNSDGTAVDAFINSWFGGTAPTGFSIGTFSGPGLGTGGDEVNIYNSLNELQAAVSFGASPAGPDFATFDNAQGINNAAISLLSVDGVNGAFIAANSNAGTTQIGSPGAISAVPEPSAMLLIAACASVGAVIRRKRVAGRTNT